MPDDTLVLRRVDYLIHWYDRHATTARIWYCGIKVTQIVLAAAVPVAAGLDLPKLVTGSLGGLIVVLEGIQQLYRFHDNWVRYRWTTAAMEREKSLWTPGPATTPTPIARTRCSRCASRTCPVARRPSGSPCSHSPRVDRPRRPGPTPTLRQPRRR